ncbi:MAG: hypothetical protein ACRCZE_01535 [Candidatus Altimarinota bacterium]
MDNWILLIAIVVIVAILVICQRQIFTAKESDTPPAGFLILMRIWIRVCSVLSVILFSVGAFLADVEVPPLVLFTAALAVGGGLLIAEYRDRKFLYPHWRKIRRARKEKIRYEKLMPVLRKQELRVSQLLTEKTEVYREQDELAHLHGEILRFQQKDSFEEKVGSKYFGVEEVRMEEFVDLAERELKTLGRGGS